MRYPSEDERFEIYIGPLRNFLENPGGSSEDKRSHDEAENKNLILINKDTSIASLLHQTMNLHEIEDDGLFHAIPRAGYALAYVAPIILALANNEMSAPILTRYGDSTQPTHWPILAKARKILDPGLTALAPIRHYRHFLPAAHVKNYDSDWNSKRESLVWRGAPTGPKPNKALRKSQSREWVIDLHRRSVNSESIDVGFANNSSPTSYNIDDNWKDCLKPELTLGDQLKHKYLLSLEGNDVASGLKWMLSSNSVVLMPEPSIESWFCETLLRPWVHYIPVAPDLSDVEEKLDWCMSNDSETEYIAKEGSKFAHSFLDPAFEVSIFRRVLRWYAEEEKIQKLVHTFSQNPQY
jgi:hypothetical protein